MSELLLDPPALRRGVAEQGGVLGVADGLEFGDHAVVGAPRVGDEAEVPVVEDGAVGVGEDVGPASLSHRIPGENSHVVITRNTRAVTRWKKMERSSCCAATALLFFFCGV